LTAPLSRSDKYFLTPFRKVHPTSDQYGGMRPPGSWALVYGFSVIALLIVLVACCNFMNLATARATLRAREIGVRKLAGEGRRQLMRRRRRQGARVLSYERGGCSVFAMNAATLSCNCLSAGMWAYTMCPDS
jgi:hypothetical protein